MPQIYPKWKYHKIKGSFYCPSEEFFNSLEDNDEYEDLPFTGPRAESKETYCASCKKNKLEVLTAKYKVNAIEILLEDSKVELEDSKLEVARLRAAIEKLKKEHTEYKRAERLERLEKAEKKVKVSKISKVKEAKIKVPAVEKLETLGE